MHAVAAAYLLSTPNGSTCGSLSGTALYETYAAGQEESGCVYRVAYCRISFQVTLYVNFVPL